MPLDLSTVRLGRKAHDPARLALVRPHLYAGEAPPPAVLGASATTNGITLTWPAALTNYILEAATNLFQPIPWLPVTNTPLPVGDRLTVTVPVSDYQFFRLHQQ